MKCLPFMGNIGGLLCPDKEGIRFGYSIAEQCYFPLQIEEKQEENPIQIGRFYFSQAGFIRAQRVLAETIENKHDLVLVDEIGKLEIKRNEGLEPVLASLIQHHQRNSNATDLLLVVRDFLLEDVIAHYQLVDAEVIHDLSRWKKAKH